MHVSVDATKANIRGMISARDDQFNKIHIQYTFKK